MQSFIVNSLPELSRTLTAIDNAWHEYHYIEISIKRKAGQRTITQNKAMHLFFNQLATILNDAGLDMRRTLKHEIEIPWTPANIKEHLWRPVQTALTQKTSTTEITTVEPTKIHEVLCRYLAQKFGVICPPWPAKKKRGK